MKEHSKSTLYFYQDERLSTVREGEEKRTAIRYQDQPLAENHERAGTSEEQLLASDTQSSILKVSSGKDSTAKVYTAYGYAPTDSLIRSMLSFNGEHTAVGGLYLLGNGYRAYSPQLMRFHSSDNLSPFNQGGLNSYAYCEGDPVNKVDPSGHFSLFKPTTWFRSNIAKASQRLKVINNRTPNLFKYNENLNSALDKRSSLGRGAIPEINKAYNELKSEYTYINKKAEGVSKYGKNISIETKRELIFAKELMKDARNPDPRVRLINLATAKSKERSLLPGKNRRDNPYSDGSTAVEKVRRS